MHTNGSISGPSGAVFFQRLRLHQFAKWNLSFFDNWNCSEVAQDWWNKTTWSKYSFHPRSRNKIFSIFANFVKFSDTRGKSRDGNGTGREQETRDFSFPTAISRPFRSLVSIAAVYHPVVWRLVSVPTVSRPTVRPLPNCFPSHRLYPVVPIPSRRPHTISPIPHLNVILGQLLPFHLPPVFSFPHHMTMDATISCYLIVRIQQQQFIL